MQPLLLTTKIQFPYVRPDLIPRQRLLQRLDSIARYQLVILCAPPGYGKTTLLCTWAGGAGMLVAWLTLDPDDGDPQRFCTYLIAAWQQADPAIRENRPYRIAAAPGFQIDDLLAALANFAGERGQPLALVLDDYHHAASQEVNRAIAYLLDHLPSYVHILITSRRVPELPLSRLRARGRLLEIGERELRFSEDEARAFFTDTHPLPLTHEHVQTLVQQTEGWPAGMQLAALALGQYEQPGAHVADFSGRSQYIVDFLAEEVFNRQPPLIQEFLRQTAFLDRLTASLCDAVTGREDSREMLRRLEQENLFLIRLDDERRWYRYHQLYLDYLQGELQRLSPEKTAELHQRAGRWYLENREPDRAFACAREAGDDAMSVEIIQRYFLHKFSFGELKTVFAWLNALPFSAFEEHPMLHICQAFLLLISGQLQACDECLEMLEATVDLPPDFVDSPAANARQEPAARPADIVGYIAGTRTILACFQNNVHAAETYAAQAFQLLPHDEQFFRFSANIALGDAYRRGSRWQEALGPYNEALRIARTVTDEALNFVPIHPLNALADLYVMRGHLRRAAEYREESLRICRAHAGRVGVAQPLLGWAYIRMGELLYEWNRLEEAIAHLEQGLELAEIGGDVRHLLSGHLALGHLNLAQGDLEAALEHLRAAKPLVESADVDEWDSQLGRLQVHIWLAQGNLTAAVDWAQTAHFNVDASNTYYYEIARLTLAEMLIAQGSTVDLARAHTLLDRLSSSALAAGRMGIVIEILALQAIVYHRQGDTTRALVALQEALALAEPEGYRRVFIDRGLPMLELLSQASARTASPAYIEVLVNAFDASIPPEWPLYESLSERELEVLRLMAAGLSNQEIAAQLVIAQGTVKKHAANIYGKMGIKSRTQAVRLAREYRLLPATT